MTEILKTKHKLPFGIFSSSVDTGYNAEISSSFKAGIDIANLHGDNYSTFEDSPAQGPFTDTHVGGNQHRHVPLNTGSQTAETRPEAFLINFETPGELRVYGPDTVSTARPRASMLRGNSAKRPVNIRNIKSVTGSQPLGNYQNDYEIVQTSGRRINNRYLTKVGEIPISSSYSAYITGLAGYDLPDRDSIASNKYIFVERFNAPGGPDVSSRGVLDIEAEEMAPNNALPFRNLSVRMPLKTFLTQHAGPFGYSSFAAHTGSWYGNAASASYHKVNRNPLCRPDPNDPTQNETVYDNWYVQHAIPRSDLQYQWLAASAITLACDLAGYQRSGSASNKAGAFTDITFVSSSQGNDFLGIKGSDKTATITIADHVWNSSNNLELWVNNGVYEHPSWKQIRTGEHPVARALKKANVVSIQDVPRNIVLDSANGTRRSFQPRFGQTFKNHIDPPVSSRYKALEHQLIFKGSVNPLLAYEVKHTYGNNIGFFGNKEIDNRLGTSNNEEQVYNKIFDYYSDQDLVEANNPVARFLGLYFRDTVYPREEKTYLAKNRGRTEYAEVAGSGSNGFDAIHGQHRTFWRDSVVDRTRTPASARNSQNYIGIGSASALSMSPMTTNGVLSFPESSSYEGRNGELVTDTDSTIYTATPVPSLSFVEAAYNLVSGSGTDYIERLTEVIASKNPSYDSYEDFSEDVRRIGKDHTVVPEFRVSQHMDYYIDSAGGNFRADNKKIFSLEGASVTSSADTEVSTRYDVDFTNTYLNSDKMAHFDDIKKEHENVAKSSKITLRCKGIKKLLPYNGFYPQNRTVQIGSLLSQSVGPFISGYSGSVVSSNYDAQGLQSLLKPLVSPGILFNSIKGGIAVDYPIYTSSAPATRESQPNNATGEFVLADAPNYRLPFETLVNLTAHLPKSSPVRFISTFNTSASAELAFPYSMQWDGNKGNLYELAMHNFLAEVPNFFLSEGTLNNFSSEPEFKFKEFVANKTYYMDVVLQQNIENNRFPSYEGTSSLKSDVARTSAWNSGSANEFGTRISINGDRLAAGETLSVASGSVVVYNNYGLKPWIQEAELTGSTNLALRSLAMNENSQIITTRNDSGFSAYVHELFTSSSAGGWTVVQNFSSSGGPEPFDQASMHYSSSYMAFGLKISEEVEVWKSGSAGFYLEDTLSKTGPGASANYGLSVEFDNNRLIISDAQAAAPSGINSGVLEIWASSSAGWAMEDSISGTINDQYGALSSQTISGSHIAIGRGFNSANQDILFYESGSSGWALVHSIVPPTGSLNPSQLEFSKQQGFLVAANSVESGTGKGAIQVYSSASSGWFMEQNISETTGTFDVELESLGFPFPAMSVYGDRFSVGTPFQDSGKGSVYSFVSESSTCPFLDGWFPLYSLESGSMKLKQNGRLFGMALPATTEVVQFNKSLNVYDPAYMAYTPPSFYGEAIARISFTPTTSGKFTLEQIFESSSVENILNQNTDRTATLVDAVLAQTSSLAYQNKMTVSASVTLFGKYSEPNVEFDLTKANATGQKTTFQPQRALQTENTNKDRWSIGTKFEAPILDVEAYDSEYSASYSSHILEGDNNYCDLSDLVFKAPRTPWTNYADVLTDQKGVFFDVKESFSNDLYNNTTGSLLENCGFTAGKKRIGRIAGEKEISEAIVAIPYVEQAIEGITIQNASDKNKHFIKIQAEVYRTQKDNLEKLGIAVKREETPEGKTQKSSTTITDMIQSMKKFVMPPQMDFVRFDDIAPFAMYMFDFSTVLDTRDLINVWHGIMPKPAVRMEKDEIVVSHDMNKDEFFHGNKLPDNIRWMVFKVKQRANQNYFEVTSDASDDDRFRFDFQGDGKVEVVPELNFNWPFDYFSLVELSKIEVEVQLTNKDEPEKLRQSSPIAANLPKVPRGSKGKGK